MTPQHQWRVAAASVQGASHEKTGLPCQDAHRWRFLPAGFLVAAVADGAGSAPLASEGAALAAGTASDFVCDRLAGPWPTATPPDDAWTTLLSEAVSAARAALLQRAGQCSVPVNHLASTLLLLVAAEGFLASVQIGDGAIVVAGSQGQLEAVSRPAPSEYLNETLFLSSEGVLDAAQPQVWRGALAHLAVLSDGLQMVALQMPGAQPHQGFFTPLFQFVSRQPDAPQRHQALASFLASARMRERTDDDVTLILASLLPAES